MSEYQVLDKSGRVIYSSGRGSVCDETCRGCAYQGTAGSTMCCDHLLITHKRRGCPAGAGCTRRKAGKKLMSLDAKVYLLPPEKTEPKPMPAAKPKRKAPEGKVSRATMTEEEWREHRREIDRAYYARNAERLRAEQRERRKKMTPEKKKQRSEAHQRWVENNRGKVNDYLREYRRKKKEAGQ